MIPAPPVLSEVNKIFLIQGINVIEIPVAPDFGNRETKSKLRIQRKSLQGKLIVYSDSEWPDKTIFKMSFSVLEESLRNDLLQFLDDSLGAPITLVDHESRIWDVIITDPLGQSVDVYRKCGHTFEVTFQTIQNAN